MKVFLWPAAADSSQLPPLLLAVLAVLVVSAAIALILTLLSRSHRADPAAAVRKIEQQTAPSPEPPRAHAPHGSEETVARRVSPLEVSSPGTDLHSALQTAPQAALDDGIRLAGMGGPLSGRTFDIVIPCLVSRGPVQWAVIPDKTISTPHAAIDLATAPYQIKDLNSRNGVRVGDNRVAGAYVPLAEGQEFCAGALTLIISSGALRVTHGSLQGQSLKTPAALVLLSRSELPVHVVGGIDPLISDAHVLFNRDGERLTVKDLNSSNGVYVNQKRIAEPTAVGPGDTVTFGESSFKVLG
jgi:pSer/pThr/pTyr-binding forkhead associated (FHA) protein